MQRVLQQIASAEPGSGWKREEHTQMENFSQGTSSLKKFDFPCRLVVVVSRFYDSHSRREYE